MQLEDFTNNKGQRRVLFFTGAGISAESGIPTFRSGSDALWENHSIDEVCNIETFEENYESVHRFYNKRRVDLNSVVHNNAHRIIAQLQKQFGESKVGLITTNVDTLHEAAGASNVLHLHGKLDEIVMHYGSDEEFIMSIGNTEFDYDHWALHGVFCKPGVVMFGEAQRWTPQGTKTDLYGELQYVFNNLTEDDIVVVIGSSNVVVPADFYCAMCKAHTISINIENEPSTMFKEFVTGLATEGLEKIRERLEQHLSQ